MKTNIGLVREIGENGLAEVLTDRQNACGGCNSSHDCRACLSGGGKIVSRVMNPVGAKPGDLVAIDIESRDLIKGAALFYIFPVVALLAGSLIGASAGVALGMSETGGALLFGLIGLVIGMTIVKWTAGSQKALDRLVPKISKIIGKEEIKNAGSTLQRSAKGHSCCS